MATAPSPITRSHLVSPLLIFVRDAIVRHLSCTETGGRLSYLHSLLLGRFVRISSPAGYAAVRVLQVQTDSEKHYKVHCSIPRAGAAAVERDETTNVVLQCWDYRENSQISVRVDAVSSRPITAVEADALAEQLQQPGKQAAFEAHCSATLLNFSNDSFFRSFFQELNADTANLLIERGTAILADQRKGLACGVVEPEGGRSEVSLWGTSPQDSVVLLLRSWVVQDAYDVDPVMQQEVQGGDASSNEAAVAGMKRKRDGTAIESTHTFGEFIVPDIPEAIRATTSIDTLPCLAGTHGWSHPGRGIYTHGFGHGPLRKPVRVVGQHRFFMQSHGTATFPTQRASEVPVFGSEYQPEVTLWHLTRAILGDALQFSVEALRSSVLYQYEDVVPRDGDDAETVQAAIAKVLGGLHEASATLHAFDVPVVTTPALYPTAPRPSQLSSCRPLTIQLKAAADHVTANLSGGSSLDNPTHTIMSGRLLSSHTQVFVVDADALLRAAGVTDVRRQCEILAGIEKVRRGEAGSGEWVPEDELARMALLPSHDIVPGTESVLGGVASDANPYFIPKSSALAFTGLAPSQTHLLRALLGIPSTTTASLPLRDGETHLPDAVDACMLLHVASGAAGDDRMLPPKWTSTIPTPCADRASLANAFAAERAVNDVAFSISRLRAVACGHSLLNWPVNSFHSSPLSSPIHLSNAYWSGLCTRLGIPPSAAPCAAALSSSWCPFVFPHRVNAFKSLLFHGTSTILANTVQREHFRRPGCRLKPLCISSEGRSCDCQMEGFGIYLAEESKAQQFAIKKSVYGPARKALIGASLVVQVDLGHVKVATSELCHCGCRKAYDDHQGHWYSQQGYDTLFLREDSLPASRYREWAIADPLRCSVARVNEVVTKAE
jgi:hypothetical protein